MTVLLHEYIPIVGSIHFLVNNTFQCKFCQKTVEEISSYIENIKDDSILFDKVNKILQIKDSNLIIKSINELCPCITEEEYIIKNLLE